MRQRQNHVRSAPQRAPGGRASAPEHHGRRQRRHPDAAERAPQRAARVEGEDRQRQDGVRLEPCGRKRGRGPQLSVSPPFPRREHHPEKQLSTLCVSLPPSGVRQRAPGGIPSARCLIKSGEAAQGTGLGGGGRGLLQVKRRTDDVSPPLIERLGILDERLYREVAVRGAGDPAG